MGLSAEKMICNDSRHLRGRGRISSVSFNANFCQMECFPLVCDKQGTNKKKQSAKKASVSSILIGCRDSTPPRRGPINMMLVVAPPPIFFCSVPSEWGLIALVIPVILVSRRRYGIRRFPYKCILPKGFLRRYGISGFPCKCILPKGYLYDMRVRL